MALIPIKLPPGIVRQGTEYGSRGRYYDAYLVRWGEDGTIRPCGGWRQRGSESVDGAARALFPWKDNDGASWLGIGTHSNIYVQNKAGTVYDITPASFTVGRADAEAVGGYGAGGYGGGSFGTPRPDSTDIQSATQITMDNWGDNLVFVSPDDGIINQWDPPDTGVPAGPITGGDTPPSCKALVVTPEGFLFALGTTNPRTVSWCDQRDNTIWVPDPTNQAGDFALQTQGSLMCGKSIKGGVILLTDIDAHVAVYIGGTSVYGFDKAGSACGAISRQCIAALDTQAVWMGKGGFWIYNGYVQPLACDVLDYVFSDLNDLQASKTYAVRDSANSEIQFYYCSSASNEIDRCVVWNYKFNYWNIGRPARLCGADRGAFLYPTFIGADGVIYEHEVGVSYGSDTPYLEGGPVEMGNGDHVAHVLQIIPDEKTQGDVTMTFKAKFYPNGAETIYGPYSMANPTDVRFTARQAKVRFDGARLTDWRVGTPRLDVVGGGKR